MSEKLYVFVIKARIIVVMVRVLLLLLAVCILIALNNFDIINTKNIPVV